MLISVCTLEAAYIEGLETSNLAVCAKFHKSKKRKISETNKSYPTEKTVSESGKLLVDRCCRND